jgi:hypothetical protein
MNWRLFVRIQSFVFALMFSLQSSPLVAQGAPKGAAAGNESEEAAESDDKYRKSPYFVDGVHCEGFEGTLRDEELKRTFADDESAEIGVRSAYVEQCESLFRLYGISKFQWVTPSDLEKLSFAIRHGGKFAKSDIRIEKSALPNHIHIIGKFSLLKPEHHYSGSLKSEIMASGQHKSARYINSGDFLFEINRRGSSNPAPYAVNFKFLNTFTNSPLTVADINSTRSAPLKLNDEEIAAFERRNGKYQSLNLRFNPAGAGPLLTKYSLRSVLIASH